MKLSDRACLVIALLVMTTGPWHTTPAGEVTPASVQTLMDEGRFEEAVAEAAALFRLEEQRYGGDSLPAAEALQLTARSMELGGLGETSERLEKAMQAVDIKRRLLDDRDPSLAWAVYGVGFIHYFAGDAALALPHFEEALRIAERYYGDHHAELEPYIREYGVGLYSTGRHAEARTEWERLYEICLDKYGAGKPGMLKALFNLALVNKAMGELARAEPLYLEAIAILKAQDPPDYRSYTWTLDSYAALLHWQGRLREALEQIQRVLELRLEHDGPEAESVAGTLNNLARMLMGLGDYDEAQAYLEQSLRIQSAKQVRPGLAAKSRINLAIVHREQGNLEKSKAVFEEVRGLLREGQNYGRLHEEFAKVLEELGETQHARLQYDEALEVLRDTDGEHHFNFARALVSKANFDLRQGEAEKAHPQLTQALSIFEKQVGKQHARYANTLDDLSVVYRALRDDGRALEAGIEAEGRTRDVARVTLGVLTERQALAQATLPRHGRDVAISLAVGPSSAPTSRTRVYDAVIRGRAVVFDEIASRNRFYGAADDSAFQDKVAKLRAAKTRLANLFVLTPSGRSEIHAKQLEDARRGVERLEAEVAAGSREFRDRLGVRDFGLADLRDALPEKSACVSFVRYASHAGPSGQTIPSYAAIVQKAGSVDPLFVDLGPATTMDRAVAKWRAALRAEAVLGTRGESHYRDVGSRLRQVVWDPLAKLVADTELVLVVPDGSINLVSFASLPVDAAGYLLERGPAFHYLTAERDLTPTVAPDPSTSGLLAVGNPAFNNRLALRVDDKGLTGPAYRGATPECRGFDTTQFESLPGASSEVKAVGEIWRSGAHEKEDRKPIVLSGRDASEVAVRRHAPGKRVIHLATHGYFLGDDCGTSGSFRGIGGLSSQSAAPTRPTNPLLLSGIALAGANRRADEKGRGEDDGILTAEEISTLNLQGVRLAVLSACRSGSGSVTKGEGVFGLRRAFLTAGVATVVTNLWDVEDRSARNWIEHLYRRRLLEGASIPHAMRGASQAVLDSRREAKLTTHPFFWGGWIAVGRID